MTGERSAFEQAKETVDLEEKVILSMFATEGY